MWMFVEALAQWREVRVTSQRRAIDWAYQVQQLVNAPRYEHAEVISLVCDNLNIHTPAAFYQAFEASEALWLSHKIQLVHTPKQGSWLNVAEAEFSVLSRQCLSGRTDQLTLVEHKATQWAEKRNQRQIIDWHFTTSDARIKLKRLYPVIKEAEE